MTNNQMTNEEFISAFRAFIDKAEAGLVPAETIIEVKAILDLAHVKMLKEGKITRESFNKFTSSYDDFLFNTGDRVHTGYCQAVILGYEGSSEGWYYIIQISPSSGDPNGSFALKGQRRKVPFRIADREFKKIETLL